MAELIAARYGSALFDIAMENNEVDQFEEEVKTVINILREDDDLLDILSHPKISTEEKEKIIEDIFNGKVSNELMGLIDLTMKKGRQGELVDIFQYFLDQVDAHKGIIKVQVTTIEAITDDYRIQLTKKLEEVTKKQVVLEESIDESLIGGIVIRISDRIVDNSIKGQMKQFSKELLTHTKV